MNIRVCGKIVVFNGDVMDVLLVCVSCYDIMM